MRRLRVNRLATALAAGALTLAGATIAAADKQKVKDGRGEPYVVDDVPHCDVVNATASHKGNRLLVHKVKIADSAPKGDPSWLQINTRGGKRSEPEYDVLPEGIIRRSDRKEQKVRFQESQGRTVFSYKLNKNAIGSAKEYGWQAIGPPCGDSTDVTPGKLENNEDGSLNHRYKVHESSP